MGLRYSVSWSHTGQVDVYDTYEDACAAVRSVLSDAHIGHDGDIRGGGERTLFWSGEPPDDDDGARAAGDIHVRHPEEVR